MSVSRIGEKLGSLNNDDGDINENGKKKKVYIDKTTTLQVHHAFLYISLPSLHDHNVKIPNFTFGGGLEDKTTTLFFFSWTSIQPARVELQKKLPTLDELNEMEYTRAITFQTVDHRSTSNLVTFS